MDRWEAAGVARLSAVIGDNQGGHEQNAPYNPHK